MNQKTSDHIKRHIERQIEAHGAVFLLAQANPHVAKHYYKYWQTVHVAIAVATFFSVLGQQKAARPPLLPV